MLTEQLEEFERFNNDYGSITSLPLDIPIIQPDDWGTFWTLWNEQKEPLVNEYTTRGKSAKWEGMDLIEPAKESYLAQYFCQDLADACHGMIRCIQENFPFEQVAGIKLWTNTGVVPPHTDRRNTKKQPNKFSTGNYFPRAFRVMLHDENTRPTFYMSPTVEKANAGEKHYVSLPGTTNSFVFNDSTAVHGADYEGRTKVLIVLQGKLDTVRYLDLMQRSMAKYQDVAMRLPYEMDDLYLGD